MVVEPSPQTSDDELQSERKLRIAVLGRKVGRKLAETRKLPWVEAGNLQPVSTARGIGHSGKGEAGDLVEGVAVHVAGDGTEGTERHHLIEAHRPEDGERRLQRSQDLRRT